MKHHLKIKAVSALICALFMSCVIHASNIAIKSNPSEHLITRTHPYNKKLNWRPCKKYKNFFCSSISVPLSYNDPNKGFINIPILLHKANIKSKGTVFINFGGPGVDSFKFFSNFYSHHFPKALEDNFDLITHDPRGVTPNPLTCRTHKPKLVEKILNNIRLLDGTQQKGAAQIYELVIEKQKLCHYGKIAKHISTAYTVKDMDHIRQALHLRKIDFIGYSYGTRVGLAYLLSYPKHSNDFILDGNVFPTNSYRERVQGLTKNSEDSILTFFDFCAKSMFNCPLYHNGSRAMLSKATMRHKLKSLLHEASAHGIPTSKKYQNQPLTAPMLYSVLESAGNSTNWEMLASGLNTAIVKNNGDKLMQMFIGYGYDLKTRTLKHIPTNFLSPYGVVCVDYNVPLYFYKKSTWVNRFIILHNKYPLAYPLYDSIRCIKAFHATPSLPKTKKTFFSTANVLLIGNTYDPRTSFRGTLAVSKYLDKLHISNYVLEWRGVGHTYISNGPKVGCIPNQENSFLLSGEFPIKKTCNDDWVNPFVE